MDRSPDLDQTSFDKEHESPLNDALGSLVVADENGVVVQAGNSWENRLRPDEVPYVWPVFRRLRPEVYKQSINAVQPKVIEALEGREGALETGNYNRAINATRQAIRAIKIREFNTSYAPSEHVRAGVAGDHTAYRRKGDGTVQYRRITDKLLFSRSSLVRKPEEQVHDEMFIMLHQIGQMPNLEKRLGEVASSDASGRTEQVVRMHQPNALRTRLGELSFSNVISESNPLHARWSGPMSPQNVHALRQYMIDSSSKDITGDTPKTMSAHIDVSGIIGSVRPRVIADYLGISYEEWDAQRYGTDRGGWDEFVNRWHERKEAREPVKVPSEVIDQINFLIMLDGIDVGGKTTETMKTAGADGDKEEKVERPRTALDLFVEYGAGRPWTEITKEAKQEPGYKSPLQRITENRQKREQLEHEDLKQFKETIKKRGVVFAKNGYEDGSQFAN